MAALQNEFDDWLSAKLKALNTDQDVYSSYIKSILEGDESDDEKLEALEGILVEIELDSTMTLCKEILDKWTSHFADKNIEIPVKQDLESCLASIMQKQAQTMAIQRNLTEEERQYRESILAQYSNISDNEEDTADNSVPKEISSSSGATSSTTKNDSLLVRNTNAEDVIRQEKEKRDKAKAEVEKKRALDKANKEKQKQQQQERKEKEKKRTQKGERKR